MVWFQCEVCGENLKKPKLPNHFRICSANKLSCIDCGQIFGQQTVQGHTQCITEAEKYGPKGQGRSSGASVKPKNDTKQKTDFDINVGLSERAPWFCSLCKTNATSKQTLILHAEGKRHRAKARAFHAANQQPKQAESTPTSKILIENNQNVELPGNVDIEQKDQNHPKVALVHRSSEAGNGSLLPSKKRKLEESKTDVTGEEAGGDMSGELENEGVIQVEGAEKEETKNKLKKAKHSMTEKCNVMELNGTKEDAKKKIKWKKLIKSALKLNPDGIKLRKLRQHVLEVLRESGFTEDESQITDMLEQKINSSSKFTVDGKFVRLVAKS